MKRGEIWYFDKPGPENTQACLELLEKGVNEGYRHLVVASTTGDSGAQAARRLAGRNVNLVVVGHCVGFKGPNIDEFLDEHYQEITRLGGKVLKATILTHSLDTAIADQFKGSAPTLLIANTLRRLGQGLKVCCEIVMEAVDAGLIPEGEEVVAAAGTARGWDTVSIIKSAASKRFLNLAVLEIWAKPRG
ncbi:MAG: pyruvate kinase alpha/beta domain-containing protein [Desulfobaccales bacterium]|nr:pyruvate kinase alpha/beta domain-containing protein [Desulfobaccales bacterium]